MKNRPIKVLSVLCALAMLFALLPAAFAEDGEEAAQKIPAAEENVLPEEPAAEEPEAEPVPADDPVPGEAPAPVVEADSVMEGASEEESAPAEEETPEGESAAAEDIVPAEEADTEEVTTAEETVPVEEADTDETITAGETVPAEEADTEEATTAGETVPAEEADTEEATTAEETVSAEQADSAEESDPAEESVPAEETAPAEKNDAEDAIAAEEIVPAEEADAEKVVPVEDSVEETVTAEESAAEEEAKEETEEEAVEEEPVKLTIGDILSDTVTAGREYKIELKATQTGSVMLTLILNRGQAMSIRIGENEAEFTEVETGDPARIYFICEMEVTEGCDYSVILTADEDTPFTLKSECSAAMKAAEPAAEEAEEAEEGGEKTEEEPAAEEQAAEETEENEEVPVVEEPAPEEEPEQNQADEEEMLNAGYIRVMIIRQNGTSLFAEQDEHAEAVGSLACGEVVWAKPAGDIWGEVYRGEESEPLFFNLNNAALQLGEVGYDVPVRKVELSSSLEGLTEIEEGSWVVINAEISGFTADEIADITWQYRASEDEEFRDIEDAHDFMYVYPVSSENVHYEWRIVLTIKS